MGATYTRQSSYSDGDTITAAHTNDEFNQLLAAFAVSTGHTHDGTAAEGGPITKLLGNTLTFGAGTSGTDITITFDGETTDGVLKWMEDEDYFEFSDDILVASTEKLQFRDTAIYINSSTDGQLDLVADTEIQIAATTIDINGNVDISGTLTIGSAGISEAELEVLDGLTVSTTEVNILDGDTSATSTTVADADRVVMNDNGTMVQVAVTDLAAYFDDEITAMPNLTSVGTLSTLTVDNVIINGTTIGHTSDTDLMTLTSGVVTVAGELDATTLDISGNADIDGTTNLDAVDIDGVVQIDGATTFGVDDTGVDVKFFGATSGAYLLWDESADKLLTAGGAVIDIVKDKLLIGGTAVTTTAAELNILDGKSFVDEDDMSSNSATAIASQQSIKAYVDSQVTAQDLDVTSDSGTIDIDLDSETLTIAGGTGLSSSASSTTVTLAVDAAQTGITSLLATDIKIGEDDQTKIDFETADEIHFYANNVEQVYLADNIFGPQSDSDVDLGSSSVRWKDAYVDSITVTGNADIDGDVDVDGTLEADAITVGGTDLNTVIAGVTVTNATTAAVATTVTISDNESTNEDNAIIFTAGGDVDGGNIGLESDGDLTYNPSTGRLTATQLSGTLQTAAQPNITSVGTLGDITAKTSDGAILKLQTSHASMVNNDIVGAIEFSAPDESSGTDAITTAASIVAEADATWSSSKNECDLVFKLGSSGAASEKMRLTHEGSMSVGDISSLTGNAAAITLSQGVVPNTVTEAASGNYTPDMSRYTNFILTVDNSNNCTLQDPTDEVAGQSGIFVFIQDGTGGGTLSHADDRYFVSGGTSITLSTAANAIDIVPYFVQADGKIHLGVAQKAFAEA
tara:strand:- start:145 stop:2715 length:2571 start_codon:yes stop_codon:yes gene_type:complete